MVKSIKGKEVNIAALVNKNKETVAVGSHGTRNANGDIIKKGKIIKTFEEQLQEIKKARFGE